MKKKITLKKIVIVASPLIITAGVVSYFVLNNQTDEKSPPSSGTESINYNPPTAVEKKNTEDFKDSIQSKDGSTRPPNAKSSSKTSVKPIITSLAVYGNSLEASSRVPGIIEDGGLCTLTMTRGGQKISATQKGVANVSETSCGAISIQKSKISSGTWTATITYSSTKASGVSDSKMVKM